MTVRAVVTPAMKSPVSMSKLYEGAQARGGNLDEYIFEEHTFKLGKYNFENYFGQVEPNRGVATFTNTLLGNILLRNTYLRNTYLRNTYMRNTQVKYNLSFANSMEQTRRADCRHVAKMRDGWLSFFFFSSVSISDKKYL